ncbi:MAG: helix-turn-helix domain-containing protein, partial [Spirochaetota bacterium]
NVIPIKVPELKDRRVDIPLLVDYYLTRFANDTNSEKKAIEDDALELLTKAEWQGNVRELINIVERLNVMVDAPVISKEDVLKHFMKKEEYTANNNTVSTEIEDNNVSLKEAKGLFEKRFIIEKLKENDMNISKTAQSLDMERSHLHRKIKQYNIIIDRDNNKIEETDDN